jgi:hypothetical protein
VDKFLRPMTAGIDMQREQNMLSRVLEIDITSDQDDEEVRAGQSQSALQRLEHRDRPQPVAMRVAAATSSGRSGVGCHGRARIVSCTAYITQRHRSTLQLAILLHLGLEA